MDVKKLREISQYVIFCVSLLDKTLELQSIFCVTLLDKTLELQFQSKLFFTYR